MWMSLLGFVLVVAGMVAIAKAVIWWEDRKRSMAISGGGRHRRFRPPSEPPVPERPNQEG
jgi:hypothetical protein